MCTGFRKVACMVQFLSLIHIYTVRESEKERINNMVKPPLDSRVFNALSDKVPRPNKFRGHWNGFYFGFVNFGKTNYSKYGGDNFMELDWASSFTMHFNFAKFSFGLSPRQRFGIFTGFGFDYSRLSFDGDITVRREKGEMLRAVPLSELDITDVKRKMCIRDRGMGEGFVMTGVADDDIS